VKDIEPICAYEKLVNLGLQNWSENHGYAAKVVLGRIAMSDIAARRKFTDQLAIHHAASFAILV
jgi:hypothetical protein